MAAIKLQKFLGTAPKLSSELLPDGAGQIAYNLQLYSGDLIPYSEPAITDSVPRLGVLKTLYGLRATVGSTDIDWLTWTSDVDIVTVSDSSDNEQRFYYTGDGAPKVSTFALATDSHTHASAPYPVAAGYYDLGLPLPTTSPVATAASYTSPTTTYYARDSGNTAIITTATAHGFRDGSVITVRGFTGSPASEFNVTNTRITVTSSTTFEYYNAGATQSATSDTNGVVDLAGGTITRDYTYTWYTPWTEESIGADPSTTLYIKEGQQVTLTSLPTAAPAGDNFIRGINLYRTLTTASGTEFYKLSTLWFPQATVSVSLTSNVATVTMATHHNFIVGDRFKLTGCTDSTFDIVDGIVTVVDSDTAFSYAVTNADIASTADTTGTLYHDVAELSTDDSRYWGDSSNTTTFRARTSGVVTLTTAAAHGLVVNQVVTVASMTDGTYDDADVVIASVPTSTTFTYVGTGGVATTLYERTTNVSTLTTSAAHGLSTSDVVNISGMTDTTFNETSVTITVTGATTFTYPNTGGNAGSTADTGGLIKVDEASTADTAGTISNYSFTDDFDYLNLVDLLLSDTYDAPNEAMVGLVQAQNNMLFGFFDNQLCIAEPGKPWAWPLDYRRTFEYDIVAIENVGGNLVVLTGAYAYRVAGNDPYTLSVAKIDTPYPCLSKRSVVNMGYGVLFATYGGLAMWSAQGLLALATKYIHDWDTWDDGIDPTTIVGHFFNDKYFGSHSAGSFLFERDEQIGGYYITAGHKFNSAWTDPETNTVYTASDSIGSITQWGNSAWPLRPMEWKSKTLVTKDYINIGAARVVADYTITAEDAAAYTTYNNSVATYNAAIWVDSEQLQPVNGPTDYVDSGGVVANNFGELNRTVVHGDGLTRTARTAPANYTVIFQLWQNKNLVMTRALTDSNIFRCPTGYKSDTFEVSVSGSARVRAIHVGETPDGLRKA
jgi:hypothetical protein